MSTEISGSSELLAGWRYGPSAAREDWPQILRQTGGSAASQPSRNWGFMTLLRRWWKAEGWKQASICALLWKPWSENMAWWEVSVKPWARGRSLWLSWFHQRIITLLLFSSGGALLFSEEGWAGCSLITCGAGGLGQTSRTASLPAKMFVHVLSWICVRSSLWMSEWARDREHRASECPVWSLLWAPAEQFLSNPSFTPVSRQMCCYGCYLARMWAFLPWLGDKLNGFKGCFSRGSNVKMKRQVQNVDIPWYILSP